VPYRVLKVWRVKFHQKLSMKHLLTPTYTLAPNKASRRKSGVVERRRGAILPSLCRKNIV
jgi:hypothetical protein